LLFYSRERLILFIALGFLDEALNDFMDRAKEKGKHYGKIVERVVSARLSLEIGALAVGFATGNFAYFFWIFMFDLAYNLVDKAMPFLVESFEPEYGPQLALDLYKCDKKRLGNKAFLRQLLEEFPAKIGMRAISKPHIMNYTPEKKDEWGLSCFVIIAESHITIHTYPERRLAKIDVVSCKAFDHERASELMKKAFLAEEVEAKVLYRGKHYPKDVKSAAKIAKRERNSLQ